MSPVEKEAFTRAFGEQFGATPAEVRARGGVAQLSLVQPLPLKSAPLEIADPQFELLDVLLITGLNRRDGGLEDSAGVPGQWEQFAAAQAQIKGGSLQMRMACVSTSMTRAAWTICAACMSQRLDRSRAFYERVLGKQPYVANDRLVGFDVAGALLAVYSQADEPVARGRNVVPYLRVQSADAEFARLEALDVQLLDAQVVVEGPIRLFRFADPDGNVLELFSLVK